jgi:hypothetical protein
VRPWHCGPLAENLAGGRAFAEPWDTGALPEKIHFAEQAGPCFCPQILKRNQNKEDGKRELLFESGNFLFLLSQFICIAIWQHLLFRKDLYAILQQPFIRTVGAWHAMPLLLVAAPPRWEICGFNLLRESFTFTITFTVSVLTHDT